MPLHSIFQFSSTILSQFIFILHFCHILKCYLSSLAFSSVIIFPSVFLSLFLLFFLFYLLPFFSLYSFFFFLYFFSIFISISMFIYFFFFLLFHSQNPSRRFSSLLSPFSLSLSSNVFSIHSFYFLFFSRFSFLCIFFSY